MLYRNKRLCYQISILNMLQSSRRLGTELRIRLSIVIIGIQFTTSETSKGVQNAAARAVQWLIVQ